DFQHRYYRDRKRPFADRIFGAPDVLARWGSRFGPLARLADKRGWAAALLSRMIGFDRRRSLPSLANQPFTRWFRKVEAAAQPAAPRGDVALFPDTFTNYFEPQIGMAASRVLWALGYRVVLAPAVCCGRPAISRGMLDRARRLARESVRALGGIAAGGTPIVGLEPSCLFSFRDEIPDLVPEDDRPAAEAVAGKAVLFDEFLADHREELSRLTGGRGEGSHVLAHGHCHQKTFCGTGPLAGLLTTTGAEVTVADSGCCGMAGSFGYTSDHYEISLAIGERRLFPAVRGLATEDALVAAGTSCRHQVLDATKRHAIHPAEYVAQYLADGGGPDAG
ncbi:MAG: heterodisulfide reductase-related iron-sulfur binding cluster, partial [Acidobacteria bacterium]|nr:heterodisulfide reductase-related iron-sulfur binding cluster [Acidobacteriota bacterium]